ncbi:putative RING-H2 finger protein ATL21A [Bienertia sinuspersici]
MNNAKSTNNISIKFPFCIKDDHRQPDKSSCQSPEFKLHQNDMLGPTLALANAGTFTVDNITYSSREIKISDPNDCLPQKLLWLDFGLITPFAPVVKRKDFRVYNCSGVGNNDKLYDEIDCLKGSSYTVISVQHGGINMTDTSCKFLKNISVPTSNNGYYVLSKYSSISLTWDEENHEPFGK